MEGKYIQVRKTAQYFTLGKLSASTKNIWFVCHGYGQLVNYFIKRFDVIADERTYISARSIKPILLARLYRTDWRYMDDQRREIKWN